MARKKNDTRRGTKKARDRQQRRDTYEASTRWQGPSYTGRQLLARQSQRRAEEATSTQ
ncbi:MAG TPA: hypothetical protein VK145_00315 [Candidatus Nanoarchaeia archaeon]|nr:hypothetical protein [Candidatus Nanoarchaeia archaeon]